MHRKRHEKARKRWSAASPVSRRLLVNKFPQAEKVNRRQHGEKEQAQQRELSCCEKRWKSSTDEPIRFATTLEKQQNDPSRKSNLYQNFFYDSSDDEDSQMEDYKEDDNKEDDDDNDDNDNDDNDNGNQQAHLWPFRDRGERAKVFL